MVQGFDQDPAPFPPDLLATTQRSTGLAEEFGFGLPSGVEYATEGVFCRNGAADAGEVARTHLCFETVERSAAAGVECKAGEKRETY